MRAKYSIVLALMITLLLVNIANSQTVPEYISSVEIYVDGFVCATCVRNVERSLMQEEGIASIEGDLEKGTIVVIPDQKVGWVNLFNFVQRINGTRDYTVLKMDVVALGHVMKFPVEYYMGGLYAYSGDRYKLQLGGKHFILASNDKLSDLISSGYETARLTGTVTSFRERVPIMQIRSFAKPEGMEKPKMMESMDPMMLPDHISSVDMHVDGFICATCVRILESNLKTEEGVDEVKADLEKGIVTVKGKVDGQPPDLFSLKKRINSLRDYTVTRMDVTALGHVVKFPVRYYDAREYTHSHDRYKLQIGDMGEASLILSDNEELHDLMKLGYERARILGTVSGTSEGVAILKIKDFQKPEDSYKLIMGADPIKAIESIDLFRKDEEIMDKDEHARIDSVRVYVDGFICATCGGPLKRNAMTEEGVDVVYTDTDSGLISLVPVKGKAVDLFSIEQRINSLRGYNVLKMEVVASGMISEVESIFGEDTVSPEKGMRYTLSAKGYTDFILSENEKLDEVLKSGEKEITAIGTVTAFRGKTPILNIVEYRKLAKHPEWLQSKPW